MRDKDYNHLNEWLPKQIERKSKRDGKKLTFERLSQLADCSRAAIYNWMTDRDRPSEDAMLRVCRVLEVPFEEGLAQYTPKPMGRPTTRSKGAKAKTTGRK